MARTAVVAGTATAVSGNVARRQQAKAQQAANAAAQQAQMAPPPVAAPAPEPAPAVSTDMVAHLKELASLRDAGILTEDEFAAQKAKILG